MNANEAKGRKDREAMSVAKIVKRLRRTGEPSTTEHGSPIYRAFRDSERYEVDFAPDFTPEGWLQFDTSSDAHYFGVWVNPHTLETLTYAEGDWSLVDAPNAEAYNAEIRSMIEFYAKRVGLPARWERGEMTPRRRALASRLEAWLRVAEGKNRNDR